VHEWACVVSGCAPDKRGELSCVEGKQARDLSFTGVMVTRQFCNERRSDGVRSFSQGWWWGIGDHGEGGNPPWPQGHANAVAHR
jgi:hypothetical protein